jgi:hypothetical protein
MHTGGPEKRIVEDALYFFIKVVLFWALPKVSDFTLQYLAQR